MDKKKALHYLKLAAKQGLAEAQFKCGLVYAIDEDVELDLRGSLRYLELAAAQGHQDAQKYLAQLQGVLRH